MCGVLVHLLGDPVIQSLALNAAAFWRSVCESMDSRGFIILLFNRMAAVAPHDVAVYVEDELVPGVMGEVERKPPHFFISMTETHRGIRERLIKDKIRELYDLQPGDRIRSIDLYDNLIKYEIYQIIGPRQFQPVIRRRKAGGGRRRSTRKRPTRRLKPKRHTK